MATASGYRTQVSTFAINASATESEVLHVGASKYIALYCPTITSCQLFAKAAPTLVGSFYRIQNSAGTTDFTLDAGAGLKVYHLPERFTSIDHLKIETGVTQTNTVIFSYILGW